MRRVELRLAPQDLSNVRFVFSPLWECIVAFRAWQDPARHALLLPWISRVNSKLAGTNWEPLRSLASVPRGTIPDFLSPPPPTPLPRLSEELDNLRRTPAQIVRKELEIAFPHDRPKLVRNALDSPERFLCDLASLLEKFWTRALAPDWSMLRQRLEGEVLFRARALAFGGPVELFKGIHRDVFYKSGSLTIITDCSWDGKKREQGILLMPSIFSWPDVFLAVNPPWRPCITYPARGIAELWGNSGSTAPKGLPTLLGKTRTRVLLQLRTPYTTMGVARALRLSPAAVSEQIVKLLNAGVLERTRMGRQVFYTINANGKALLAIFAANLDETPST